MKLDQMRLLRLSGALAVVLALLAGCSSQSPSPVATPTATTPQPTAAPDRDTIAVEELDSAVAAALARLADSPGVEGIQTSYVERHLASTVWFDSRPNGDVAVVQHVDRDVLESGWWNGPADAPPAIGENIVTTLWVVVDDSFYEATLINGETQDGWSEAEREAAPSALALGLVFLSGEMTRLGVPIQDGDVQRTDVPDGGTVWGATSRTEGGIAVQTWNINPDGTLDSYTWELIGDRAAGPDDDAVTGGRIDFQRVDAPESIAAPDLNAEPDPGALGAPNTLPLGPGR